MSCAQGQFSDALTAEHQIANSRDVELSAAIECKFSVYCLHQSNVLERDLSLRLVLENLCAATRSTIFVWIDIIYNQINGRLNTT